MDKKKQVTARQPAIKRILKNYFTNSAFFK